MTRHKFKRERKRRGTQEIVGILLGIHPVTICKWETGALKLPRMAGIALMKLPTR